MRDKGRMQNGKLVWKDQRDGNHGPRGFVSGNQKYQRRRAAQGHNRTMGRCSNAR